MKSTRTVSLAAVAVLGALASVVSVSAAEPPNTGFDLNPDIAIGGGSDTSYLVSQRLEVLYNGAPGCLVTTSSSSSNKGRCSDTGATATGPTNGNYDHDLMLGAAATGSSSGVTALLSTGVQYNPPIDWARSSRGPSGTETNELTFWGYARDGISVLTFGSRQGVSFTRQNLIDIYTCQPNADNWADFGLPAGPIIPWSVNTNSGTYASFLTYLGNPTLGTCVRVLTTGVAPFENDVKPILADQGPVPGYGPDDDENNYLIWMSTANWLTYPFTKNGFVDGNLNPATANQPINSFQATIEGTTPSDATLFNSTYAIMRTVYHVTRNADADCRQTAGSAGPCDNVGAEVYGADTGKRGAVREFTEWMCRTSNTQHATNTVTGRGYRTEIVAAINAEGFQQLSSAVPGLRTAGYACEVRS
jgi:ABC-type phosphate transport system substrate-binding protein